MASAQSAPRVLQAQHELFPGFRPSINLTFFHHLISNEWKVISQQASGQTAAYSAWQTTTYDCESSLNST